MQQHNRRNFIQRAALLTLGSFISMNYLNKLMANEVTIDTINLNEDIVGDTYGPFALPKLNYGYDALEPHIDKLTMEIHHSKHHQAYITNLNKALETVDKNLVNNQSTLNDLFANMKNLPMAIRNNGGGHYNHSLFWTMMKPNGGGEPIGKLATAITRDFGSFEEFKKQFADSAAKRFGSGWAWLVLADGKLKITSTANQDNPLMNLDSVEIKGKPILALDVWEHAYYLKNQNRRADYIASFWNVVNWNQCEELFNAK